MDSQWYTQMTYEQFRLTLPVVDLTALDKFKARLEVLHLYKRYIRHNDFYRVIMGCGA